MIQVINVSKSFLVKTTSSHAASGRIVQAVRDVSLSWNKGEFFAIVGESGCGKTTLGRLLAGHLLPTGGEIQYNGVSMSTTKRPHHRHLARLVQLIPQDPYAALNPVRKIRGLMRDPITYHRIANNRQADELAENLLQMVGLSAKDVIGKYPHQLSGGQRQRLVIARALTVEPQYLIADEAVSMVDVSLRIGIMDSLKEISRQRQLGLLFITHDFRVARYIAQGGSIAVMYLGQIVEQGPTEEILGAPLHPYTQSLISAVPILEGVEARNQTVVPSRYEISTQNLAQGCSFANRCPFADQLCKNKAPSLLPSTSPHHLVACHHAEPRELVVDVAEPAS
ncbi:MAG: ABC transporter ATP-binding protein [Firmicutes bacterium]|nr:ABC transporter ATP-binding protein [Bacillota bacterium]